MGPEEPEVIKLVRRLRAAGDDEACRTIAGRLIREAGEASERKGDARRCVKAAEDLFDRTVRESEEAIRLAMLAVDISNGN